MGENHFEYVIVSLQTGKKHWRHRTMSHDDGSATHLSLTVLSVMLRWLSLLLTATAATVGVTILMDCELHGCLFLLESDQRAFPGTGQHSPHTNGSKFKL